MTSLAGTLIDVRDVLPVLTVPGSEPDRPEEPGRPQPRWKIAAGTLAELAAGQNGFFTRAQALNLSVSDKDLFRVAADGRVVPYHGARGVWRVVGAGDIPHQDAYAVWLATNPAAHATDRVRVPVPDVVIAGPSAAWVWGIGDFIPEPWTVLGSTKVRRHKRGNVEWRTDTKLTAAEVRITPYGLPVTSPARTVHDLFAAGHDLVHVADAAADAVASGLTDRIELAAAFSPWTFRQFKTRNPQIQVKNPAQLVNYLLDLSDRVVDS